MTKPKKPQLPDAVSTSAPAPNQAVQQIVNNLQSMNMTLQSAQVKGNTLSITAVDANNQTIRVIQEVSGRYQAQTMSSYTPTTPQDRREVVRDLRKQKLTQQEIAFRLGVSQKTISDDIKKIGK